LEFKKIKEAPAQQTEGKDGKGESSGGEEGVLNPTDDPPVVG